MTEAINIIAEKRDRAGKGVARAARREGKVPAIIYGNKLDPLAIKVDEGDINKLIKKPGFFTQIFAVDLEGSSHQVLARDIQFHPVSERPLHIDFFRFNENTKITMEIPVVFVNEDISPGLKRGGVLNIVRREIELSCSPLKIPQEIEIDLEGTEIGESIHITALNLPEGTEPITDRDFTIATVAAPTVMKTEEEEAQEAAESEDSESEATEGVAADAGD